MSEATKELIQMALDQDYNNANKAFGEIMTIKMNDLLDQEQIRLADQIYNGVEETDIDDISDEEVEAMLDADEGEDATEEEDLQEPDADDEIDMDDEDDTDEDEGLERADDNEGDEGSEES